LNVQFIDSETWQSLQDIRDIIDSILAHLREKEQGRPTLSHLVPTSQAPLGHYVFSQDANPQPQISKDATEKRVARTVACSRSGMDEYELRDQLTSADIE
jgi:hypothetical protein